MKNIKQIEKKLKTLEIILKEKFKVKRIGLFGSFIKGEQEKKSDIDILVEFSEVPGFFDFIELEDFLAEKLEIKVDLVMKDVLKPRIKDVVLKEVVYI